MRRDTDHAVTGARMSWMRAMVRVVCLLAATVAGTLYLLALRAARLPAAGRIPRRWHRLCTKLLDMDMRVYGRPETEGPLLYVCNHASYLDVTALGAVVDASFIAKSDVARWPVIGPLCRLQNTVFIDRTVRTVQQQAALLSSRLEAGDSLVLFPEGTSNDGNYVRPFKSTLFRAADAACGDKRVKVQPVTIAYVRLDGLPMGRSLRPYVAWYGDMTLVDHLFRCFGIGRIGVDMIFHQAVDRSAYSSRKTLAQHCHTTISKGLSDALSGRLAPEYGAAVPPEGQRQSEPLPDLALPLPRALETVRDI
ncbi:MAG: 1-acyl-sn-glycerol-3-phosphate acyltransferase [Alphaproteobacteria bacterium]|nr:1-acyl-sn-glycerol-3-phosphate acyltransferase [Alphaproteobacteria bacterium]